MSFSADEFDEILEKCKDKSQQERQDGVSLKFCSKKKRDKNLPLDGEDFFYYQTERDYSGVSNSIAFFVMHLFLDSTSALQIYTANSWKTSSHQARSRLQLLAQHSVGQADGDFRNRSNVAQLVAAVSSSPISLTLTRCM